jgi:hypothetical protein
MFANGKGPPKPQIRKVSIQRAVAPSPTNGNTIGAARAGNTNGHVNARSAGANHSASRQNSASTLHPRHAEVSRRASTQPRADSKRASPARGKRKQPSPRLTPNFGSSSSEDEDNNLNDLARKRARHSPGKFLEEDLKRVVCDHAAFKRQDGEKKEEDSKVIQGYDITAGYVAGKEYKIVFENEEESESVPEIELRYPSCHGKERSVLRRL